MKQYSVVPFHTSLFSGHLDPVKLAAALNEHGQQGWRFVWTIHETKRAFAIFSREAHFLVFEREV